MKYLFLSLLLIPAVVTAQVSDSTDSANATVFFIVRHAEKNMQESSSDPSLSPEGSARAARLAAHLRNVGLTAVYATRTKRAMLTAAPTAENESLKVLPYGNDLAAETARFLDIHRGKRLLVVGHSNTVPLMLNILTKTGSYTPNEDYDALYMVILAKAQPAEVVLLRY